MSVLMTRSGEDGVGERMARWITKRTRGMFALSVVAREYVFALGYFSRTSVSVVSQRGADIFISA